MRNLAQYPITKKEIIEYLLNLSDQIATEGAIGDVRPLLLTEAVIMINRSDISKPNQK